MERDISKSQRIPICAVGIWLIWLLLVPGPVRAQEQASAAPVVVSTVRQEWVAENIVLIGTTEAVHASTVAAEVAGVVEAFSVREGDYVEKGALLAKLGDREIRLAMDQSTARLDKVRKDYERARSLLAEGLISKQMHQDLSLQLTLAKADYELARKRLEDTSVMAPISGVITNRSVKVGDLVTTTKPSTPLS